jgi:serine/threonine protein kinase
MMEYLQYSVEEYLALPEAKRKLKPEEVFVQMLQALKALHDMKIIHKDVKPDNFRIHDDQVRIIDFGISDELFINGKHVN